jgi:hypothetical protein
MDSGALDTPRKRQAALAGALVAALGSWIGLRLLLRSLRIARRVARWTWLAATFRLYRRCPDCKGVIRRQARVCRHCRYRLAPRPRHR